MNKTFIGYSKFPKLALWSAMSDEVGRFIGYWPWTSTVRFQTRFAVVLATGSRLKRARMTKKLE